MRKVTLWAAQSLPKTILVNLLSLMTKTKPHILIHHQHVGSKFHLLRDTLVNSQKSNTSCQLSLNPHLLENLLSKLQTTMLHSQIYSLLEMKFMKGGTITATERAILSIDTIDSKVTVRVLAELEKLNSEVLRPLIAQNQHIPAQ